MTAKAVWLHQEIAEKQPDTTKEHGYLDCFCSLGAKKRTVTTTACQLGGNWKHVTEAQQMVPECLGLM